MQWVETYFPRPENSWRLTQASKWHLPVKHSSQHGFNIYSFLQALWHRVSEDDGHAVNCTVRGKACLWHSHPPQRLKDESATLCAWEAHADTRHLRRKASPRLPHSSATQRGALYSEKRMFLAIQGHLGLAQSTPARPPHWPSPLPWARSRRDHSTSACCSEPSDTWTTSLVWSIKKPTMKCSHYSKVCFYFKFTGRNKIIFKKIE